MFGGTGVAMPAGESRSPDRAKDIRVVRGGARATQLGGSVVAGPEDAGPIREPVLADPAGATFSVSQLTAGP